VTRRALGLCVLVAASLAVAAVTSAAPSASGPLGGFASLRDAASSVSKGCAKTAGLGLPQLTVPGALPGGFAFGVRDSVDAAVSYVTDRKGTFSATALASSAGPKQPLENDAELVALWPCRRPVAFYFGYPNGRELTMWALGAPHSVSLRKVTTTNLVFDSRGKVVTPPASPLHGWNVARFSPSPRQPSTFLAEVERNCTSTPEGADSGRLYVISPAGSRQLASYDSCSNPPLAAWSPNGSSIFWTSYSGTPVATRFHVSSVLGSATRNLGTVRGNVTYALWSPDGSNVAYSIYHASRQVGDVVTATGVIHHLTNIHWTPTRPPRQPPYARVIGWTPDSKRVLVAEAKPNGAGTSVVSVPVLGGGRSRVLIRLPQ
jgi:hypothetical protein